VEKRARLIEETLASFGAPGIVVDTSIGPTVTMFGVEPRFVESRGGQMRVRVAKIASLADDLGAGPGGTAHPHPGAGAGTRLRWHRSAQR